MNKDQSKKIRTKANCDAILQIIARFELKLGLNRQQASIQRL